MTYKELAATIRQLPLEQQEKDVSVFIQQTEEIIPCYAIKIDNDPDSPCASVLDVDYPVLILDF